MRTLKLLCAVVVAAAMMAATTRDAAADSAAVTNYKQAVTRRVETWSANVNKLNDTLSKLKIQLGMLSGPTPSVPTTDPQALAKDVRDRITGIQDSIRYETNTCWNDIKLMTVSPPDKSEAIPLPGFVQELIKAKGIPFAKNVSFAPNVTWNFKSGTLGSAGGTINITFMNP